MKTMNALLMITLTIVVALAFTGRTPAGAQTAVVPLPKETKEEMARQAAGRPVTMSISTAKALATYAPRPQYPYEARAKHLTGFCVVVISVNASGNVTDCKVVHSTGSPILDNAATSAFRQWRFKPGSVSKVKIPVTFTMTKGGTQ